MKRPPIFQTINTPAEYKENVNTFNQLCYTARFYRDLINDIPSNDFIPQARQPYRELDRAYYAKQAERADKEAQAVLIKLNEYENREIN